MWPRIVVNPNKWAQAIAAAGGKADTFDPPRWGSWATPTCLYYRTSDEIAKLVGDWIGKHGLVKLATLPNRLAVRHRLQNGRMYALICGAAHAGAENFFDLPPDRGR